MTEGTRLDTRYIHALAQVLHDTTRHVQQPVQLNAVEEALLEDFETILTAALHRGVAAVYLSPGSPIEFQQHGEVIPSGIAVDLWKVDKDFEKTYPADGFVARYVVQHGAYEGRVATLTVSQISGADFLHMNILPERILTPAELHIPDEVLEWSALPHGLVLLSGKTASGKTTTMRSLVRERQLEDQKMIVSVERPVGLSFPQDGKSAVVQRDGSQHSKGFEGALKSSLRCDPDIIALDEVRSLEEIDMLALAVETGHMVISTIHTNSATQSLVRLTNVSEYIQDILLNHPCGIVHQTRVQGMHSDVDDVFVYETLKIDETFAAFLQARDWSGIQDAQDARKHSLEHALVRAVLDERCTVESARAAAERMEVFDRVLATRDV